MSKIHRVKTELRNGSSLKAAIERQGLNAQFAPDLAQNTLRLVDYYGNVTMCAMMVSREDLAAKLGCHLYGGIGWVWNGTGYDVAVDHIDTGHRQHIDMMAQLNQDYTRAEILAYVDANPQYTYQEETLEDGTIRVLLTGY